MEITNGIHIIPGTVANSYLIIEPSGLVLVDTGLPGNAGKILRYIESLGYSTQDIKHIIVTHADDDHYGSLAELAKKTGASTYASAIEAESILQGLSSRPLKLNRIQKMFFNIIHPFIRAKSVKINHKLDHGQTLQILGGLQVIFTPGHTPGHISLFCPSQGILFAGDSMRSNGEKLIPSEGLNTWNEEIALDSVRKQSELGARIVCVGHGPVVYEADEKFPNLNGIVKNN